MDYRIGVLGGMGPLATQYFLDIFFKRYIEEMKPVKDQDFPDMTILMESSTPDRTEAIKNDDPSAGRKINRDLERLVSEGCQSIVVPCFTGHSMIAENWFRAGVIDIRRAAAEQYEGHKGARVAILATDGSLISGVFESLEKDFELIYPEGEIQADIMKVIYDSKGDNPGNADNLRRLESIKSRLSAKGAEFFLAGCTEIEMFAGSNNVVDQMILPMDCLCWVLLKRIRSQKPIVNSAKN